jgi:hypothetical protein
MHPIKQMLEVVLPRCSSRDRLLRLDTGAWAQKHGVLGLNGVAHPDSMSDRMRRFAPQASESRNRPPRLTWGRSGVSKLGHYPAPCGVILRLIHRVESLSKVVA